ncbi:MAG: hypothetical protein MUP81_01795 [Dehalococcoidia bacterium]|nr:hypothetical protein [Dehalococcoidia bacterium]
MLIEPQLRQRILRSLRYLVRDSQSRVNFYECTQAVEVGNYSPELKEAIQLLQDLEQGDLVSFKSVCPLTYTEEECINIGILLGMTVKECAEFYVKYGSQGWLKGNGLPIVNLNLAMREWKMRGQEDEPEPVRVQGKTPRQLYLERQNG